MSTLTKTDLVSKVKIALRVSTADSEIAAEVSDIVDECIEDLTRSGDNDIDYDDPLILSACKCYAKAYYGYDDNATADAWLKRYNSIKVDLGCYGAHTTA